MALENRAFIYKKAISGECDVDIGECNGIRKVRNKVSEVNMDLLSSVITVTVSDLSKGWDWLL